MSSRDMGVARSLAETRSNKLNVAFNAPSGRPNGKEYLEVFIKIWLRKIRKYV